MVITGAAEAIAADIASIVYLDAFIPDDGQSMGDITKRELPTTGVVRALSGQGDERQRGDRPGSTPR